MLTNNCWCKEVKRTELYVTKDILVQQGRRMEPVVHVEHRWDAACETSQGSSHHRSVGLHGTAVTKDSTSL